MKKFRFAFLVCVPLFWFFFKLLPIYTHPADCSTANFKYAENLQETKIWCFDKSSNVRYDDSSNFLYTVALWILIHFLKFTTVKAAITINSLSLFASVYLLHKIIDSRFWSVHLLLIGMIFMSTQIWAGVLGDEIIFQGMLWLFVVHSFWKHRYIGMLFWSSVNIAARPDNVFIVLPFIILVI